MEPKNLIVPPLIAMVAMLPFANGIAEAHPWCGGSGWDQCHALPPDEMPPNNKDEMSDVRLYGQQSPTTTSALWVETQNFHIPQRRHTAAISASSSGLQFDQGGGA
jgi:hypothetical protein